MNILHIIIIVALIYVVYRIIIVKENYEPLELKDKRYDYLNDLEKYSLTNKNINEQINGLFVEGQFHTDYRDTITAFGNLVPAQKQIFNMANVPVSFTNPNLKEVTNIVKDFIKELNRKSLAIEDIKSVLTNKHKYNIIYTDEHTYLSKEKHFVPQEQSAKGSLEDLFA